VGIPLELSARKKDKKMRRNALTIAALGFVSAAGALDLLADVSQPDFTQWSVVYEMTQGEVEVAMGRDYDRAFRFPLER
jgi:hypothetical protein